MQFDHHHQVLPSILQEFMDQFNHFSMHKRDIFRRIEVAADTVEEPMVPIKEMLLHLLPKSASRQKIYAFPGFATRLLSKSGTIKRYLLHTKPKGQENSFTIKISKVEKIICHFSLSSSFFCPIHLVVNAAVGHFKVESCPQRVHQTI